MIKNYQKLSCLAATVVIFTTVFCAAAASATTKKEIHDSMSVEVGGQCTFQSDAAGSGTATSSGKEFVGSAVVVGNEVDLYSGGSLDDDHDFKIFCNARKGYTITAYATPLTSDVSSSDTIDFVPISSYVTSGEDSNWTVSVTGLGDSPAADLLISNKISTTPSVIYKSEGIGKSVFTVAYSVYVGTSVVSGSYSGTAIFTVTPEPEPVGP